MEPLHINEADAARDLAAILTRVQAGAEVVIERDRMNEAAMSAVRLARAFTGRDLVVKFAGCYHAADDFRVHRSGGGARAGGRRCAGA